MEPGETGEKISPGKPRAKGTKMSLQKAIDMGEYNPAYLSTFPEWQELSPHIRFQFIKTAIENRRRQLVMQYADICNVLDFRLKPELKETLDNIHKQLKKLDSDFEKISMEYFK
jgi:hypothetical protein